MNLLRFARKCLTNPAAASRSAMIVLRSIRGKIHWRLHPTAPLRWRLPSGGTLLLEPGHSFTRAFWPGVGAFEPEVRDYLLDTLQPGHVFVDCGSNVGYFSVLAGGRVGRSGRVIAIEANPITYQLAGRNLAANGLSQPIHCALTTQQGTVELFVPESGEDVYSSLRRGGIIGTANLRTHLVPGRTLDAVLQSLHLERIDIIKIDVEGAEIDVLRSATDTLARHRPRIIIEYSTSTWGAFGSTAAMLQQIASAADYRISRIHTRSPLVRPIVAGDWHSGYANLLLSPRDNES